MLDWCQPRYPDSPVTGVTAAQRQAWYRAGYSQDFARLCAMPRLSIWVDDDSQDYLVARHQERESLTGERQSVIWDWGHSPATFLPTLREQAMADGHLVVQQFEGVENPWSELGFLPELRRVIAPALGSPKPGEFAVRRAEPKDLFFISKQHTQSSQFYLPANRNVNAEEMLARSMNAYMAMDLSPENKKLVGFVICEGNRPFGYILYKIPFQLEVSRARAAYLYDLNLKAEYWGRNAGGQLGMHSLAELNAMGIQFVVGDISASNEQSYQAATRAGRFKWESTRWGLHL